MTQPCVTNLCERHTLCKGPHCWSRRELFCYLDLHGNFCGADAFLHIFCKYPQLLYVEKRRLFAFIWLCENQHPSGNAFCRKFRYGLHHNFRHLPVQLGTKISSKWDIFSSEYSKFGWSPNDACIALNVCHALKWSIYPTSSITWREDKGIFLRFVNWLRWTRTRTRK